MVVRNANLTMTFRRRTSTARELMDNLEAIDFIDVDSASKPTKCRSLQVNMQIDSCSLPLGSRTLALGNAQMESFLNSVEQVDGTKRFFDDVDSPFSHEGNRRRHVEDRGDENYGKLPVLLRQPPLDLAAARRRKPEAPTQDSRAGHCRRPQKNPVPKQGTGRQSDVRRRDSIQVGPLRGRDRRQKRLDSQNLRHHSLR